MKISGQTNDAINSDRRSLALWSAATILAASSALSAGSAFAQDEKKTFALVQINQQALFFNQMNEGAQQAADAAGAELVIFNANNDSAAQNSAIETYITEGVDGLVVVAIDVNGVMPAVEQADAAGIPVVAVDAILPDDGPQKAQVGVDNAAAGADMAGYVNKFAAGMDAPMQMGVVGALNSFIQNVRKDGFVDALDGVEVVATVDGQNVQDIALTAAENLMTANPTMNAIYATGEPALLGAIAAVESQGRQDDVTIFGWDLTAQAIDGIDAGYVEAVVQQSPAGMGAAAVDALASLTSDGTVEAQIDVPITIVTIDNVDDYRDTFK
ncbi:MAG: substrate-binding domain-containing protein [Granulosicoccus sp.]